MEEAVKHRWIKTASNLNRGTPLDVGSIKSFISKEKGPAPAQVHIPMKLLTDESMPVYK